MTAALSRGDSGAAVHTMQEMINQAMAIIRQRHGSSDTGDFRPISADGDFGPDTERAVRLLQTYARQNNIRDHAGRPIIIDGMFGRQSSSALDAMIATAGVGATTAVTPQPHASPDQEVRVRTEVNNLEIRTTDIVPEDQFQAVLAECRANWLPGLTERGLRNALDRSVREINTLHPEMRATIAMGMRHLYEQGHPVMVVDGHRDGDSQNEAFFNRTSGARAGQSFHNFGLAVDMVQINVNGDPEYRWRNSHRRGGSRVDYAGRAAESVRLIRHEMLDVMGLAPTELAGDLGHFQIVPGNSPAAYLLENGYNWRMTALHREGTFIDFNDRSDIPQRVRGATAALLAERNPPAQADSIRVSGVERHERHEELPSPLQVIAAVFSGDRDRAAGALRAFFS